LTVSSSVSTGPLPRGSLLYLENLLLCSPPRFVPDRSFFNPFLLHVATAASISEYVMSLFPDASIAICSRVLPLFDWTVWVPVSLPALVLRHVEAVVSS